MHLIMRRRAMLDLLLPPLPALSARLTTSAMSRRVSLPLSTSVYARTSRVSNDAGRGGRRKKAFQLATNELSGPIGLYTVNNRGLATCRRSQPFPVKTILPDYLSTTSTTTMLSQYVVRFMSTVQQTLTGASVKQAEQGHISSLLADTRANMRVQITACGELYKELSKTKPILFSGAPQDGIQFEVHYYDTIELLNEKNNKSTQHAKPNYPTVCLLHGAPGHYRDFADLIYHLTSEGVRVIAPNFPDYSATFEHSFRHSPRERLDYLLEFFKAINVHHLDLLAGHSSAVYTMFELLNHSKSINGLNDNELSDGEKFKVGIKSLGLLSTPSHVLPHNLAVTPFRLFTLKLFDYPILRPFIMTLIQTFVRLQGIRNRVEKGKIENLLIAASAMGYSQHNKMERRLRLLDEFKIPALLIYGTKDRLITVNNFKQLEKDLGITSEDQVKRYKSDGSVEFAPRERHQLVDVSRFESGGHYTFQKYSSQVSEDIYNFLIKRVLASDKACQPDCDEPTTNQATSSQRDCVDNDDEATKL